MKFWVEFCLCSVRALRLRKERELQKPLAFMKNTLSWYISFVLMSSVYGKTLNVYYINWNLMLDKYAILLDKIPDKVRDSNLNPIQRAFLQGAPGTSHDATDHFMSRNTAQCSVESLCSSIFPTILNCCVVYSTHLDSMPVTFSNLQ